MSDIEKQADEVMRTIWADKTLDPVNVVLAALRKAKADGMREAVVQIKSASPSLAAIVRDFDRVHVMLDEGKAWADAVKYLHEQKWNAESTTLSAYDRWYEYCQQRIVMGAEAMLRCAAEIEKGNA